MKDELVVFYHIRLKIFLVVIMTTPAIVNANTVDECGTKADKNGHFESSSIGNDYDILRFIYYIC